jgi:hypothetical protein
LALAILEKRMLYIKPTLWFNLFNRMLIHKPKFWFWAQCQALLEKQEYMHKRNHFGEYCTRSWMLCQYLKYSKKKKYRCSKRIKLDFGMF